MLRPTIDDVARIAGVSKSTVSRVLSGNTNHMRDETRQRVEKVIGDLQYRPSSVARSLTSNRTYTVGLLISDVSNPFYPEVIHGVEDVALTHGYDVFLCNTNYDLSRGMHFVQSLIAKQVDGVMIMSSSMSDDWITELARYQIPTVVLDWHLRSIEGVAGSITVDFDRGISAAADHLVALGHEQFAHVSGPLGLHTSRLRRDAFLNGLARNGIDPVNVPVVEGNLRIDGGSRGLDHLLSLSQRPTAIFAANDLTALGIIWAARDRGLRVPEDLSVIGLDNIRLAAEIYPPLTTVALPQAEIGGMAMRMLLKLIQGNNRTWPTTILDARVETHLIIRGSTARLH
jgi:LacI family transcriptional regulator